MSQLGFEPTPILRKQIFNTRFLKIDLENFSACPQGVTGTNWVHDSYKYVTGMAYRTYVTWSPSVGLQGFWENHHFSIVLAPQLDILWLDVPKSRTFWSFFYKTFSLNYNLDLRFSYEMNKFFPRNLGI